MEEWVSTQSQFQARNGEITYLGTTGFQKVLVSTFYHITICFLSSKEKNKNFWISTMNNGKSFCSRRNKIYGQLFFFKHRI